MISAILVAAGSGLRMGQGALPKQFIELDGIPILAHTLKRFAAIPAIEHIVLVTHPAYRARCEHIIAAYHIHNVYAVVEGGKERQDSVLQGLEHLHPKTEFVLIHDAVRIFVTEEIISASIQAAREVGACITAVPAKDTIKEAFPQTSEPHNPTFVANTLDRSSLWQVQTPQTFRYQLIMDLHRKAKEAGVSGTDDAMLVEHFGHAVQIVRGSYRNIKITTPDDLLIAATFLHHESEKI